MNKNIFGWLLVSCDLRPRSFRDGTPIYCLFVSLFVGV